MTIEPVRPANKWLWRCRAGRLAGWLRAADSAADSRAALEPRQGPGNRWRRPGGGWPSAAAASLCCGLKLASGHLLPPSPLPASAASLFASLEALAKALPVGHLLLSDALDRCSGPCASRFRCLASGFQRQISVDLFVSCLTHSA